MSYIGTAILIFFLLTVVSAGWYFLFKRFERRMSSRFDDLVSRHEEALKSFSDVIEIIAQRSRELHEHLQKVKIDCEAILHELELADKKSDLAQGLQLVIKHDRFLDQARSLGKSYCEKGEITEQDLTKLEQFLDEMKLENYSRY